MNCSPFYHFLPGQRHLKERQSTLQSFLQRRGRRCSSTASQATTIGVEQGVFLTDIVQQLWYRSVMQPATSTGEGEAWMLLCNARCALRISYTQKFPDQRQDTAFLGRVLMPADLISAAGPCWRLWQLCCTGHCWRDDLCFQMPEPHPRKKVGLAPSHCCSPAETLLPEHGSAITSLHHQWSCFILLIFPI